MRQIALETSSLAGSVAALENGRLCVELALPAGQRSGRSLAPAIGRLLKQLAWQPRQVELVSVTTGPGSFTGLRIGVTTAKTFAYATGAEVLGVNTLDAIADQAPHDVHPLEVALPAERGQLFVARYLPGSDSRLIRQGSIALADRDRWLAGLVPPVLVSGPAVDAMLSDLPEGVTAVETALRHPSAAAVGRLAARSYAAGERGNVWELVPEYFRPSAAEEKLRSKRGDGDASRNSS